MLGDIGLAWEFLCEYSRTGQERLSAAVEDVAGWPYRFVFVNYRPFHWNWFAGV